MHSKPIQIAVVGHTNVGKTSLLRTLTRDQGFGEVDARPSTTRQVEGAELRVEGEALVALFDTPGLEEPIALLEALERIADRQSARLDGPARIAALLAEPKAVERYAQEVKVLRQLQRSDAGLLVIDVRDPVLAKHRDELVLLAMCGVPLLPVLNFVRGEHSREAAWREVLARSGLHAQVRFDTVAPDADAESRLYTALATLLPAAEPPLQRLLAARQREVEARHRRGRRLIAELLIDVAAARYPLLAEGEAAQAAQRQALGDWLRAREQQLVEQLLLLYRFENNAVESRQLPLLDGQWAIDLLHPELLKQAGLRIGSGAAAGAAAGVGIDLLSAGLTLGAAATLGALAGGGAQAARHYGRRLLGRLQGRRDLSADDAVLRLLGLRGLALQAALEGRGHAATDPVRATAEVDSRLRSAALPAALQRARGRPGWSSLHPAADDPRRADAVETLAEAL